MTAAAPSLELRKIADELERTTRLGLQTTDAYAAVCKVAAESIRAALQADPVGDHYRDALQSIASDFAHSKGNVDRTDAYAQTALDALNTPPLTALQADRAAGVPIGYIDRKDVARLSNYKATIWPGTNEIDAVPVYTAAPAAMMPSLNIRCETARDGLIGSTRLHVVRVEPEDDGSFTAVTDYWPPAAVSDPKLVDWLQRINDAGSRLHKHLGEGQPHSDMVSTVTGLSALALERIAKPTDEAPAKGDVTVSEFFASVPEDQIDVACEEYNRASYEWTKQSDPDMSRNRYAMRAVIVAITSQDSPT